MREGARVRVGQKEGSMYRFNIKDNDEIGVWDGISEVGIIVEGVLIGTSGRIDLKGLHRDARVLEGLLACECSSLTKFVEGGTFDPVG